MTDELTPEALAEHCAKVIEWMTKRRVTPFLGAGVNLADRPPGAVYERGKYLPNGTELAKCLADKFKYPWADTDNLLRVSWYVKFRDDQATLYDYLHEVFNPSYAPTSVHQFLASLPKMLEARGHPKCYQTIVTTNYDDVLERALEAQGEEFDVLYFQAEGANAGFFYHIPYKQKPRVIDSPQDYQDLPIDVGKGNQRTIIVKIHGALNRIGPEDSSFVITEDDYIDYLSRAGTQQPLPKVLEAQLRNTRFLFLGYSLRDWNMRVFIRRISLGRNLESKSWAVMDRAEEVEEHFWRSNKVEIWKLSLTDYIAAMTAQIQL